MMTAQPVNYYQVKRLQREEIAPYLFTVDERYLSKILIWTTKFFLPLQKI
jgi:hypothetical protein